MQIERCGVVEDRSLVITGKRVFLTFWLLPSKGQVQGLGTAAKSKMKWHIKEKCALGTNRVATMSRNSNYCVTKEAIAASDDSVREACSIVGAERRRVKGKKVEAKNAAAAAVAAGRRWQGQQRRQKIQCCRRRRRCRCTHLQNPPSGVPSPATRPWQPCPLTVHPCLRIFRALSSLTSASGSQIDLQ